MKILLADDHSMFRETLRNMLTHFNQDHLEIVGEAADAGDTLALLTRHHPDLLLLDYKMPGLSRISAFCKQVAGVVPACRILILSGYAEEEIALEAALGGARGYILKGASVTDLLNAIAAIHAGGIWVDPRLSPAVFQTFLRHRGNNAEKMGSLTRQELQVLSLLAQGINNREIGERLHIEKGTVRNHLTHVFQKLGVTTRGEAARYFLSGNMVPGVNGTAKQGK